MPKESIYIDSCVWIAQYSPKEKLTSEQRTTLKTLFESVGGGSMIVVASAMLMVETLTVTNEILDLGFDGVKGIFMPVDDTIARAARILEHRCYKDHKKVLGTHDAIHLCTASLTGCKRFVTLDRRHKDNQLSPLADRDYLQPLLNLKIISPDELDDQKRLDLPPGGIEQTV